MQCPRRSCRYSHNATTLSTACAVISGCLLTWSERSLSCQAVSPCRYQGESGFKRTHRNLSRLLFTSVLPMKSRQYTWPQLQKIPNQRITTWNCFQRVLSRRPGDDVGFEVTCMTADDLCQADLILLAFPLDSMAVPGCLDRFHNLLSIDVYEFYSTSQCFCCTSVLPFVLLHSTLRCTLS